MSDTITMPRGEFAAYQKAVEYGKAEIARLASEPAGVRNVLAQQQRAVEAEKAARSRSDALVATLREHLDGEVSRTAVRIALAQYDEALRGLEGPTAEPPADTVAERARTFVGSLKRFEGEDV